MHFILIQFSHGAVSSLVYGSPRASVLIRHKTSVSSYLCLAVLACCCGGQLHYFLTPFFTSSLLVGSVARLLSAASFK